jgi:hypothetical protein
MYAVLWLQPKEGGVSTYAINHSWIQAPLCAQKENAEDNAEDNNKSRVKRKREAETPWWQHVRPRSLITSCTGKFRMATDLAKMNFRLPSIEWEDFFIEIIASLNAGTEAAGAVMPEAERDDEERVDLDDEADDDEDDIEAVFD